MQEPVCSGNEFENFYSTILLNQAALNLEKTEKNDELSTAFSS